MFQNPKKMVVQSKLDCQKLLLSLKVTVEGLLVNQVTNVWNIYGGLNRLCFAVEKIFRHECKVNEKGCPDVWTFIQGLSKFQPSPMTSFLLWENNANLPDNIKSDKSLTWIYKNLEEHLLSKNLICLLANQKHVEACYNVNAFFLQEKYANAAIICIKAVEQNKPSFLMEIDPSLYVTEHDVSKFQGHHKRCSSLPEATYKFFNATNDKKLILEKDPTTCNSNNALQTSAEVIKIDKNPEIRVQIKNDQQNKLCNSLPDLTHEMIERERISSVETPVKLSPDVLQIDYGIDAKCFDKENSVELEVPDKKEKSVKRKKVNIHSENRREWFVVQGKKEERKKTFMEDGGISVLPMSTGYFPRPLQGQSLTSFLQSEHFSRTVAELDRENAHFSISEAMISAIEQMKCNRQLHLVEEVNEDDSDEEINHLKQRIRLRRRQRLEEKHMKTSWSVNLLSDGKTDTTTDQSVSPLSTSPETPSESISTDDIDDLEVDEESNLNYLKNSDISVSMASLYSEADVSKIRKEGCESVANAEKVALSLLRQFKEKQLPRASDLQWLVSEEDAPQELLPLPKSWPVSPDDIDKTNTLLLRGTTDWAPPRPQIIFTQHPPPVRMILLGKQNFRCSGCGLKVAPKFVNKFRYCEYLGKYFCTGCHTNQLSLIPGHILFRWNFKRFPVSTFSYRLIDQMSTDPLFPIKDLNPDLYKKVKALEKTRQFRLQLYYFKDFLFTCRFGQKYVQLMWCLDCLGNSKKQHNFFFRLQENLEKEPPHIIQDPEMYSLQDLVQVKTGELVSRLKELVKGCFIHVQNCQLCSARGFVCELCPSKEPIYPWFIDQVSRCSKCGACFHFQCFKPGFCPRCARVSARKQSSINSNF